MLRWIIELICGKTPTPHYMVRPGTVLRFDGKPADRTIIVEVGEPNLFNR